MDQKEETGAGHPLVPPGPGGPARVISMKERLKMKGEKMKMRIKEKMKRVKMFLTGAGCLSFLALLALVGCQSSAPASRANTTSYGAVTVTLSGVTNSTVSVTYSGDGVIASADGGGDSQTASPQSAVTPTVSVPVNKAGAGQSVGSAIGDAVARMFGGQKSNNSESPNSCPDGVCEDTE